MRYCVIFAIAALIGWSASPGRVPPEPSVSLPVQSAPLAGGEAVSAAAVGHEFRQDDWPAVAVSPDGSAWAAWLSFDGGRDDIGLRRHRDGKWENLQWVPATSGDSAFPQVVSDGSGGVWIVWSQQVDGNWDIYARRFDPERQTWDRLERLSSDPLPDINLRAAAGAGGRGAVVWQGFRGRTSSIFLRMLEGGRWGSEVRVTARAANDWEPAVALDSGGTAWVAYDSYGNGNYDVFVAEVRGGLVTREHAVAATARFEARPTVAADARGRVWVAYEAGLPNWGKDTGLVIYERQPGAPLGGLREPALRCYAGGEWREPAAPLAAVFPDRDTYQPLVVADALGSIWVAAKKRTTLPRQPAGEPRYYPPLHTVYWEYYVTRLEGARWTSPSALPSSRGRSGTRAAAAAAGKELWLAWSSDNRAAPNWTRPRREQVWAARLEAREAPDFELRARSDAPLEVPAGHSDEEGDVRAARSQSVAVAGRKLRLLRGDLHRHTDLSLDRGGEPDGNLVDMYRYMIDAAALDFGASTDHSNGAWPYWHWQAQKMADMYHVPGSFVPLFGYERSVEYPNGHRNVFFAKRSDYRLTPFFMRGGVQGMTLPVGPAGEDMTARVVENDTKLLYEELRGPGGISIPHTSGAGGGTDWRDNDPAVEPVAEIFQGCRTSYEQLGAPHVVSETDPRDAAVIKRNRHYPQGMFSEAWRKGFPLGVIASSDHFSTHLSYAMVYAEAATREAILDAIRRRRTYGAMDNIVLDVRIDGRFMGEELDLAAPRPLRVRARGTRPIVRLDVIRDSRVIYSSEPRRRDVELDFTETAREPGRHYYYVRVQQEDGLLAWSSPLFVRYPEGR